MNTITLTIAATPDNLKRLAQAFSDCIDETLNADDVPAHRRATAPEDPKGVTVKSAEIPAETKPQATAEPKSQITISMIRAKGKEFTQQGREKELAEVFREFGATKLSQIDEADYPKVYERLQEVLG